MVSTNLKYELDRINNVKLIQAWILCNILYLQAKFVIQENVYFAKFSDIEWT